MLTEKGIVLRGSCISGNAVPVGMTEILDKIGGSNMTVGCVLVFEIIEVVAPVVCAILLEGLLGVREDLEVTTAPL